jgi:hypothetical protein
MNDRQTIISDDDLQATEATHWYTADGLQIALPANGATRFAAGRDGHLASIEMADLVRERAATAAAARHAAVGECLAGAWTTAWRSAMVALGALGALRSLRASTTHGADGAGPSAVR